MTAPSNTSSHPQWSQADLAGYRAGTIVIHHGKTYRAKPWPAEAWARQPAYEPGGQPVWRYAWDEIPDGDAQPHQPRGAHAGQPAPEPLG